MEWISCSKSAEVNPEISLIDQWIAQAEIAAIHINLIA